MGIHDFVDTVLAHVRLNIPLTTVCIFYLVYLFVLHLIPRSLKLYPQGMGNLISLQLVYKGRDPHKLPHLSSYTDHSSILGFGKLFHSCMGCFLAIHTQGDDGQ